MRWSRQLRWKLFISHAVIIVIAVVILLAAAQILVRSSLSDQSPLAIDSESAATGALGGAAGSSDAIQGRFQNILEQALLIASFGALAAAVVVSLFVSRRIVEPLQDLTEVSRRLELGYYRERTHIRSDDELAQLSRSINQLAEALDRTEQRRMALLADVAHELRTPLTTIEGYMEGLLDRVIAPDEQTFTLIRREAARLQRLTEELALLSRAEAGALPIAPRPCSPNELLETVSARFQPQFSACEIDLQMHLPLDPPQIYADQDRIAQVVINLLANALRYTPANGSVLVSLSAFDDYVQIAVRDSGIGIEAIHLPHIFERFYRVDKSRARASGGTGIGLTIARHMVYGHGGEIWAESAGLGYGSCFYVTLPVYKPAFQIVVEQPTGK
jgi:histidine kinase